MVFDNAWVDAHLRGQGWSGISLFVVLAALLSAVGIPRQLLGVIAGYAFGVFYGTLWVSLGLTAGCILGFYYARLLGRSMLQKRFGNRIAKMDRFLQRQPFAMAVAIRLFPIGNNMLTNFAAGLTNIRSTPFVLGSGVGYLPQNIIFVLLGSGMRFDPVWKISLSAVLFVVASTIGFMIYKRYRDDFPDKTALVQEEQLGNTGLRIMLFAMTLLMTTGILSILPTLIPMAQEFGVSGEEATLSLAVFGIAGLCATLVTGVCADRFSRKSVLVCGLLLFTCGGLLTFMAESFQGVLCARFIQGLGSAPMGLLYTTIVADVWSGSQRARMLQQCSVGIGLGSAINPLAGGLLVYFFSWRIAYLLALCALPVACLPLFLPLRKAQRGIVLRQYLSQARQSVQAPLTMMLLSLGVAFAIVQYGPVITCFPLAIADAAPDTALAVGVLFASASLAAGFMAFQLKTIGAVIETRRLLVSGQFCYLAALVSMPFISSVYWMLVPFLFFGLGQGITMPLLSSMLAEQTVPGQRAAVMGVNSFLLRLVQAGAPAAFGGLSLMLSPQIAILSGLLAVAAGLFIQFRYISPQIASCLPED
ncbi:hypothetical protein AAG570_014053 [Ranatra chinensis]|uniref:Major facilitator superfamily (MFS) profile domain-containing protein n=1 Tax=Ranatra chinensis TaxID=642074 RepID=A0ABD0XSD1_9HEMI